MMSSTAVETLTNYDPYSGNPFTYQDTTVRTHYSFGYGGHIPLAVLGKYSTLWLVPSFLANLHFSFPSVNSSDDPDLNFDVNVPIHATVGYGALRRKAVAWGIEGGIGINAGRRFKYESFTIAPSALIDIAYAPRNVFRLRVLADLVPATMQNNQSYVSWTALFVIGM